MMCADSIRLRCQATRSVLSRYSGRTRSESEANEVTGFVAYVNTDPAALDTDQSETVVAEWQINIHRM